MTYQTRNAVIEFLKTKRTGASMAEIRASVGKHPVAVQSSVTVARRKGIVCRVGIGGPAVLWCLPQFLASTKRRYNAVPYHVFQARIRERERRANQFKQRLVPANKAKRIDIPAVNSVWSLAA